MVRSSKRVKKVKITEDLNNARLATQLEQQDSIEELFEEPQPIVEPFQPIADPASMTQDTQIDQTADDFSGKSPKDTVKKTGELKVDRLVK